MVEITHYENCAWSKGGLKQEELNDLAKEIFTGGKVIEVHHNGYSTNNPLQTKGSEEMVSVADGRVCYVVECDGFPVKFWIHMRGFNVTEIIESVTR